MPGSCVICTDEMFRKMAGNMNGLGPEIKLEVEGKGGLTGQSPCHMLS